MIPLDPSEPAVQAAAPTARSGDTSENRPQLYERALMQGLAHDLRAPLRSIDSFAALLARHHGGLDATGQGYLQRICDAGVRMSAVIDALQELFNADRAPRRADPVDLSLLADWVAAELRDAYPGLSLDIQVQLGLIIEGDEYYLKRMFVHLLDNARRFSGTRKQVRIKVEGESVGDVLHLRVCDGGIGFEMRYAENLFEPFQRLHDAEQGAGIGLGLTIAQSIAQQHGGRIRAESEPGVGSVFHIELPLRSVAVKAAQ